MLWFWAGHLAWLFPWSGLIPAVRELRFRVAGRAARTRMLMLCCCGFTLLFFSASTSQEYYTLPAYAPAMLLLASAAASLPPPAPGGVPGGWACMPRRWSRVSASCSQDGT